MLIPITLYKISLIIIEIPSNKYTVSNSYVLSMNDSDSYVLYTFFINSFVHTFLITVCRYHKQIEYYPSK